MNLFIVFFGCLTFKFSFGFQLSDPISTRCPISNTALNGSSRHRAVGKEIESNIIGGVLLASSLFITSALPVGAVSGGGSEFSGTVISGKQFSDGNYKGKDFSQTIAQGTNFARSNLQGCRFFKGFLVNADFTGSDIRGATLEDTSMNGATLKDANAAGAYFSASILDVASLENADFTDAQIPVKIVPQLCERPDAKGTNPATGVDTRESLMCL